MEYTATHKESSNNNCSTNMNARIIRHAWHAWKMNALFLNYEHENEKAK